MLNCDEFIGEQEQIYLRNGLFTAITRSRAWARLSGIGEEMKVLRREVSKIQKLGFELEFTIPTPQELDEKRRLYRELTTVERNKKDKVERALSTLAKELQSGRVSLNSLKPSLRRQLRGALSELFVDEFGNEDDDVNPNGDEELSE